MNRSEHHDEADRLLEQAHAEQDSIRRHLILAEAQVHATLALSAPAGEGPPGRGQAETRGRGRVEELAASMIVPHGTDAYVAAPGLHHRTPPATSAGQDQSSLRPPLNPPTGGAAAASPAPSGKTQSPVYTGPSGWPDRSGPGDEEPDDEEPDEPGEQKPGGSGKPRPGGFKLL